MGEAESGNVGELHVYAAEGRQLAGGDEIACRETPECPVADAEDGLVEGAIGVP